MKYVLPVVVLAALAWIGVAKLKQETAPATKEFAAAESRIVPPPLVFKAAPPTPQPTTVPTPVALVAPPPPTETPAQSAKLVAPPPAPADRPSGWTVIPAPFIEPSKPAGPPVPVPQIVLNDVLGPNNLYHDDAFGLSAVYPEGWTVRGANRWGPNNSENTVALAPNVPTTARPSMYYQLYPNGYPELEGAEAYFRRVAQNKENQRIAGGMPDYKNLPGTFDFTPINGMPSASYFAAFNRGDEVHAEYYVRVLGKKGYVMFFVPGRMEDVQAIMPQISQMAASLKVP